MSKRLCPLRTLVPALLLLTACTPAPIHFYSLSRPLPAGAPQIADPPEFAVVLDPVSVPRRTDIPQLLLGFDDGGGVQLMENRRWIAPLGQEIRDLLSQQLQARLAVADVSRVPQRTGIPVYRLSVDVQRFESWRGGRTLVSVLWHIRRVDAEGVSASCTMRAEEPTPADEGEIAAAYRRALESVAAKMADTLLAASRGLPPPQAAC